MWDKKGSEKTGTDKRGPDTSLSDTPGTERNRPHKPIPDTPGTNRNRPDKPTSDAPAPDLKDPARQRSQPAATVSLLDPAKDARPTQAAGANLLFLREEEIRLAQDLLFFAYRDFTNAADVILEEMGFGRAHHRTLHFIGRNPGITVSDLLAILRITKQSLARVLGALMQEGYVAQTPGHADRRQRLLTLTPAGQALERRLFERQRERLVAAYREAGGTAVDGFRRVMRGIMDEEARAYIDGPDTHEPKARRA